MCANVAVAVRMGMGMGAVMVVGVGVGVGGVGVGVGDVGVECAVELLDFFKTYMYDVPKSEQSPMLLTDMTKAVLTLMDITPSIQ
eukprot:Pgem_evm1s11013